jgi:hypothetical protein
MGFQLIKYDDNPMLHPFLSLQRRHQNAAADQSLSVWTNNRFKLEPKKKKEDVYCLLYRKKLTIMALIVLVVTLLLALYFIEDFYCSTTGTAQSSVNNGLRLFLSLAPKTTSFTQEQAINVTLALTNVNNEALNLSSIAPQPYLSFEVRDNSSNLVFTSEDSGQLTDNVTLASGKSVSKIFYWDTSYHYPIATGVYQIVGFFGTESNSTSVLHTTPLYVTIVSASPTKASNL